ncbi:hypothetical protein DXG01_002324 [Tephrocybe rancida]|nr:hypothetical protein DXG01_002324 [Tephrocybe rancida]
MWGNVTSVEAAGGSVDEEVDEGIIGWNDGDANNGKGSTGEEDFVRKEGRHEGDGDGGKGREEHGNESIDRAGDVLGGGGGKGGGLFDISHAVNGGTSTQEPFEPEELSVTNRFQIHQLNRTPIVLDPSPKGEDAVGYGRKSGD